MAKSIRVNQLAKELGVSSKQILDKLKAEGLGDQAPNHQSAITIGLAETIREWFHHGHGIHTAVEVAPPVPESMDKPKPRLRHPKKTTDEEGEEMHAEQGEQFPAGEPEVPPVETHTTVAATEAAEPAEAAAVEPPAVAPEMPAPAPEAPLPVAETPAPEPAAEPVVPAPVPTPVAETPVAPVATTPTPVVVPAPAPVAPVAPAPTAAAASAPAPAAPSAPVVPPASPAAPHPVRKPVAAQGTRAPVIAPRPQHQPLRRTPKPAVFVPAPAQIQGPRVVRVEKEEVVNIGPPRPNRGPRVQSDETPGVTPSLPRGGRGVKKADEEEETEAQKKAKKANSLSSRRRGADGRRGEALEKLKEYTDADLLERQERLAAAAGYRAGVDGHLKKRERHLQGPAKSVVEKGAPVAMEEPITVRSLAAALGVKTGDVISKLMKQGVFATVNQALTRETAEMLALEWGLEITIVQEPTLEEKLLAELEGREVDEEKLVSRPTVVTILGHVDHGKTSLLDKIRNANVAAGEAGGITQHTAAWMVEVGPADARKRVTFIDTPGHQAFTAMRARGANMTDVVVLVVSAAEGVQPQTIESINHAKAAGVPIVVAMNKIDRADASPDMVLGQLAKEGLNPVEWGGDTEVIRTSAVTGEGIKDLIEMLDYQSELLQLKTDPTAPPRGTVIESNMAEGMGSVATILVQDGTLRVGDVVLCGSTYGKIRRILNDRGEALQQATASMPVVISGLSALPSSGDKFFRVADMDSARQVCEDRVARDRVKDLGTKGAVTLESLMDTINQQAVKEVRLIIKADVQGSVETLEKAVLEANTDEVKVRVIHAAVGPITESDVELADASKTVIIGFNVAPDDAARSSAEQRRIEVRLYRVIYEILDDLRKALSGMLEPEIREKHHGRVEVRQVFKVSKVGNIAGCMVTEGHIQRGSKIRIIRNGTVVVEDLSMESLRRVKEDVKEVKSGFECGIKLAGYDDIKIGDVLDAYVRETIQRTL